MINSKIISLYNSKIKKQTYTFEGHAITIYSSPKGKFINPTLGDNNQKKYTKASGNNLYTHFVEFGEVLCSQNIIGIVVENKRWSKFKKPPEIEIDVFDSKKNKVRSIIGHASFSIENIDRNYGLFSWLDPILCENYAKYEKNIRNVWSKNINKADIGVALLRAGGMSLKLAGYSINETAVLQAKRHNMMEDPKKIGIGLNISKQTIDKIGRANSIELAERAIASGSSLLALLMVLENVSALPNDIRITGIGAAQQGLNFMNRFLATFFDRTNKQYIIKIAKLFYTLSDGDHPYYIQTLTNHFAVLDGGDFADLLLPLEQRTVWVRSFTEKIIQELKEKIKLNDNQINSLKIKAGIVPSMSQIKKLRQICVDNIGIEARFKVGEILTGIDYYNTNQ